MQNQDCYKCHTKSICFYFSQSDNTRIAINSHQFTLSKAKMIKWIWTLALIGLVCTQNITKSEVKVENHENVKNSTTENKKSEIPRIDKKNVVLSALPAPLEKVEVKQNADDSASSDNLPGSPSNPISPAKYISLDDNGLFLKYNYVFLTIVSLSVVAVIVYKTHR